MNVGYVVVTVLVALAMQGQATPTGVVTTSAKTGDCIFVDIFALNNVKFGALLRCAKGVVKDTCTVFTQWPGCGSDDTDVVKICGKCQNQLQSVEDDLQQSAQQRKTDTAASHERKRRRTKSSSDSSSSSSSSDSGDSTANLLVFALEFFKRLNSCIEACELPTPVDAAMMPIDLMGGTLIDLPCVLNCVCQVPTIGLVGSLLG